MMIQPILLKLILIAGAMVALALFSARVLERRFVYFPDRAVNHSPSEIGFPHFQDVTFKTSDGKRIHAWWVPDPRARFTLIFCHGNAGNISHRLDKMIILSRLGFQIFIFDYRGYGQSEGDPIESGLYKDAEAACDWLTQNVDTSKKPLLTYGESLGGVVALDLAIKKKAIRGVILEDCFSSLKEMAGIYAPFIPSFLVSGKLDAVSRISKAGVPTLILHSDNDEIAPFSMGRRLYEEAKEPKELAVLTGSHNTAFLDAQPLYESAIRNFLDKYFKNG